MSRNPAATALFWFMFLTGGGALLACVYLPIWLENRALQDRHAARKQQVADLEQRLAALERQIDHLQRDAAYAQRLLRKEFGIATPGLKMIDLGDVPAEDLPAPVPEEAEPGALDREQLALAVEEAAHRSPLVSIFVLDHTRPIVMGMSAVVLVAALILMNRTAARAAPASA